MHPTAQEKTTFVTHQGLYESRVMPFRLTNAPAASGEPSEPGLKTLSLSIWMTFCFLTYTRGTPGPLADSNPPNEGCRIEVEAQRMQIRPAGIGVPLSHREPRWTKDQPTSDCSCSRLPYISVSSRGLEIPGTRILLPQIHLQFCQDCPPLTSTDLQRSVWTNDCRKTF